MPAGSGRVERLDPFSLPVRFAVSDKAADERLRVVELSRERVVVHRAVAGIPTSWSFQSAAASQAFTFVYRADPRVRAPTEIFIPVTRHYPTGYTVHVSGPAVVTSAAGASILTLRNIGAGVVTVQVARA